MLAGEGPTGKEMKLEKQHAQVQFLQVCLNCWIKAWCNPFWRCFGLRRLAMICHLRKEKEDTLKALTTWLQFLWRLNSYKVRLTKDQNVEVLWKRSWTGRICLSCSVWITHQINLLLTISGANNVSEKVWVYGWCIWLCYAARVCRFSWIARM